MWEVNLCGGMSLLAFVGFHNSFVLQTWQKHPDQLVGWFPRQVTSTVEPVSSEYHTHLQTLLFDHEYNVILTKGAIMHRKYLEAYSLDTPQELRDLVAERRNCEDILMQFVISSRTESLPVFEWDVSCVSLIPRALIVDLQALAARNKCVRVLMQSMLRIAAHS